MKQEHHLDEIDRRIVAALQDDAALTHAVLAERVGASSASCWRRIRALEQAGVLTRTVRLVDPQKIGRGVSVMLQLRMKSHAMDERRAFEAFLHDRPEIMECHTMSGEWDYLMRVVMADVVDYEHFLMRVMLTHPNVATSASHFALHQVKYTTALPV